MDFPGFGHPDRIGTECGPSGADAGDSPVGRVVLSLRGRDRGNLYVAVGGSGTRLLLVDGRRRPRRRPKAKNRRHVAILSRRLGNPEAWDDREIRSLLEPWRRRRRGEPNGAREVR